LAAFSLTDEYFEQLISEVINDKVSITWKKQNVTKVQEEAKYNLTQQAKELEENYLMITFLQ
jgi:hypothetical protein